MEPPGRIRDAQSRRLDELVPKPLARMNGEALVKLDGHQ
jgi:hypothetical protein